MPIYRVVGYDAGGLDVTARVVTAFDETDALDVAEQEHERAGGWPAIDEWQTTARLLTDAEIIAEHQPDGRGPVECSSCGKVTEPTYSAFAGEPLCLPCVHSHFAYGRLHVPEAFEEELLPACNYCGTTGHRAFDCPERPEDE